MFKVGDRIKIKTFGREADVAVVCGSGSVHDGFNWYWPEEVALVNSPIRTATRREIVPGSYGGIWVGAPDARGEVSVKFSGTRNAIGAREAARLFNDIADVLEENAA